MDTTFYDSAGRPVAYTEDGIHIYLFSGSPVAYLEQGSVYSYSGRHLGWFGDGWVWDHQGGCVLFTQKAGGSPSRPMKALKPLKAIKAIKPIKSIKQMRPTRCSRSSSWSTLSGVEFFG